MDQRWNDVVQSWFNVVSTLDTNVVSMLCNLENPTSDFVSFSTSDQRYFNGDLPYWNNVNPILKCWLGIICEKGNSYKYSAWNFTNEVKLLVIFQGLCKIIRNTHFNKFLLVAAFQNLFLRLVVSNSSGLPRVPSSGI